jgi:hypothetical protein
VRLEAKRAADGDKPLAAFFDLYLYFIKLRQEVRRWLEKLFANGYRGFVAFGASGGLDT